MRKPELQDDANPQPVKDHPAAVSFSTRLVRPRSVASARMSSEDSRDLPSPPPVERTTINPKGTAPPGRTQPGSETPPAEWDAIAASTDFKTLLAARARFVVPMTIFFIVYYFALPVLVGFFPELMKTKVGKANVAYLFALSQFFVAWIIAFAYTRAASRWDEMARNLISRFSSRKSP